jgi:hypothetical protein
MSMFPPFFDTVKNVAAVKAAFGNSPRIFPHGMADQNTLKPYCVFQVITGNPENYLGQLPDMDSFGVQVDVYAASPQAAADGAKAIRDAVEPVAYVDAWRGQFKDPDTTLFRFSFDVSFNTPR